MTEITEGAIKRAIRVLVNHGLTRAEDIQYRAMNHIADPDTIAEMHQDADEIHTAITYLRKAGMVEKRDTDPAVAFIKAIKEKLNE